MQVHTANLVGHLTPYDQAYLATLHTRAAALMVDGTAPAAATRTAMGTMLQTLHQQAAVLAYSDVFMACAALALLSAPAALLFSASRGAGGPPGH